MARGRIVICSGCIESFEYNDLYWVNVECNKGNPQNGKYRSPRCEDCIKETDSYIDIAEQPKNKLK